MRRTKLSGCSLTTAPTATTSRLTRSNAQNQFMLWRRIKEKSEDAHEPLSSWTHWIRPQCDGAKRIRGAGRNLCQMLAWEVTLGTNCPWSMATETWQT
eukprot:2799109-Amphidinium_carterae.1